MEGQPEGFWGKLKQDETGRILAWHPLVAHCADVAATTEALLEKTIFNERLARVVGHRELSRPLFLGRKPCLPASRLPIGRIRAKSVREALESAPLADDADIRESYTALVAGSGGNRAAGRLDAPRHRRSRLGEPDTRGRTLDSLRPDRSQKQGGSKNQ